MAAVETRWECDINCPLSISLALSGYSEVYDELFNLFIIPDRRAWLKAQHMNRYGVLGK